MNNQEQTALDVVFTITLVFILSSFGWFNIGAYFGAKQATNETHKK